MSNETRNKGVALLFFSSFLYYFQSVVSDNGLLGNVVVKNIPVTNGSQPTLHLYLPYHLLACMKRKNKPKKKKETRSKNHKKNRKKDKLRKRKIKQKKRKLEKKSKKTKKNNRNRQEKDKNKKEKKRAERSGRTCLIFFLSQ